MFIYECVSCFTTVLIVSAMLTYISLHFRAHYVAGNCNTLHTLYYCALPADNRPINSQWGHKTIITDNYPPHALWTAIAVTQSAPSQWEMGDGNMCVKQQNCHWAQWLQSGEYQRWFCFLYDKVTKQTVFRSHREKKDEERMARGEGEGASDGRKHVRVIELHNTLDVQLTCTINITDQLAEKSRRASERAALGKPPGSGVTSRRYQDDQLRHSRLSPKCFSHTASTANYQHINFLMQN